MATKVKNALSAAKRDISGKKVKNIRNEGFTPAVLYGPNRDSINIKIPTTEFVKLLKTLRTSSIVKLNLDGKELNTLVSEIQQNPRNNEIVHISFFEPDPEKHITIGIELVHKGLAPAVKNNLGILFSPMDEILVRCFPKDVVDKIDVDISKLKEVGDTISVKEIKLPKNTELANPEDINKTAVTITTFQKEIEEEEPEVVDEEEEGEGEEKEGGEGEEKEGEEKGPGEEEGKDTEGSKPGPETKAE